MSTIVGNPARHPSTRRPAKSGRPARTRAGKRDATRSRRAPFAGGILWIALVGSLLAGIVAVNVLVLQLNVKLDGLGRQRAELKASNALLRSQLSSASASIKIEQAATAELGLEAADPLTMTYVRIGDR